MKTAFLLLTMASLASCAPFIRSTPQTTEVGVAFDNQQVADFFFSLFSKPQETSPFLDNDKTR